MYPIITLSVTGLITLFLGFSKSKHLVLPATILFILVAIIANFIDWNAPGIYFYGMVDITNNTLLFNAIVLFTALLVIPFSKGKFDDPISHPAEYYALIQFSLVGAIMMITYQHFIMLFVGIEILSVALYVLTGSDKRNLRGNEAALKYFLMGAFATGILLFGMAMYYGATSSFSILSGNSLLSMAPTFKVFLWIGVLFMMIGLLFKISAAPFHFWTPDVYEGSPTIFTTYMSTIVKTAGFYALYRLLSITFMSSQSFWSYFLIGAIVLSLLIGNISAVFQSSMKRMLAYSSISHAGFMLLTLLSVTNQSEHSLSFYSVAYTLATISAFGVLMVVSKDELVNGRPNENINVFTGLFKRNAFLGGVLIISLMSLAGIPLTGGFLGKLFVFTDAGFKNYTWLLIVAILMSAVSIYYYFKPIRAAFENVKEGAGEIELSLSLKIVLTLTTLGTLVLGILPDLFRSIIK